MKSYLSGRQQEVHFACIQLGTTTCCIVKYGVSHTRFHNNPLLFILYINALPLYIESYYIDLYPDDSTLHCHDTKY
jgi:hypothetical protein